MLDNNKQSHQMNQVESLSDLPDITSEPRLKVRVVANNQISKDIINLSLERPDGFVFESGQYVWLLLPDYFKKEGIIDRRAYSISSSTDGETLDLLIRTTQSDYSSKIKNLQIGDDVEIIGPMGSAFMMPSSGVIMISGGTGIAPFLSVLRSKIKGNISLIDYESKKSLLHNEEEFDKLSQESGYEIIVKKIRPRLSDFYFILDKREQRQILISGSQGFVDYVTTKLLNLGIEAKRIYFEENYLQTKEVKKLNNVFTGFSNDRNLTNSKTFFKLGDLFMQVTKQTSNHVILTDSNGRIIYANKAASDMTGYSFDEMHGQTPRLWGGLMPGLFYKDLWTLLKKGIVVKRTLINRRRDGTIYTAIATITPFVYKNKIIAFIATEEDITALREIDKTKTEFISIASHQLRTPLSALSWYAEMLINGDAGKLNTRQNSYLQEIYSSNRRMIELVEVLLNVSRIELGAFVVEPVSTDIVDLTQKEINEQKMDISKKKIDFSFYHEKDLPISQVDPKLLRIIIQNILSNSIKYTPDNGKVRIEVYKDKDNILFKFSDNGYGIPKTFQSKIFTRLFRADNVKLKSTEGNGLGLYIVKIIVDKSGGKIWFESEENKGTTFYVSIPIGSIIKKEGQDKTNETN